MGLINEKKWEERWEQGPQRGPANPLFTEDDDLNEEFPENWSMDEFKSLNSFAARIRYVESHFKYIKGGSARKVFKMDDKHALKLAYNKIGLAQNEVEVDTYDELSNSVADDLLAPIDDYDKENYQWVMMRLAKPPQASDFKRHTGLSMDVFFEFIHNLIKRSGGKTLGGNLSDTILRKIWDMADNYPLLWGVIHLISNYNDVYAFGDISKKNSYGVVDDKLVLVDYGLSLDVLSTHYNKMREGKVMKKIIINESQKEMLAFRVNGLNGDVNDFNTLESKAIAIQNKLDATTIGELNYEELKEFDDSITHIENLSYKLSEYLYQKAEALSDEDEFDKMDDLIHTGHHKLIDLTMKLSRKIDKLFGIFEDE